MAQKQMQLEEGLDDLCVRFIINLPQEDLSSVARLCFQVEEAQWFYEDFIRPLDPTLPSMTLRTFCLRIFQHCPLLASFSVENHTKAFEEFLQYKTRVPVRGAIMLNHDLDSVVLVKGWKKGASWSFPRGKINKDEDDLDCAVREVYEETGLDLREAGLVPNEVKPIYIEIPMREQHLRLYVFRDVPMDTAFQPRTRKEISKIDWYKLSDLPTLRKKGPQNNNHYDSSAGTNANKFYMVAPFLVPLKKWIVTQKKNDAKRATGGTPQAYPIHHHHHQHMPIEEDPTEDEAWVANNVPAAEPTIESLDGATRELHRLLNLQPSIQPSAAPAAQPAAQPSIEALLAQAQALRAKNQQAQAQQVQTQQVQTMQTSAAPPSIEALLAQAQAMRAQSQQAQAMQQPATNASKDKGSALLSLLQSSGSPQRAPQGDSQLPNALSSLKLADRQPPSFAPPQQQSSAALNLLQNLNGGLGNGAPPSHPAQPVQAITTQQTFTATSTIKTGSMPPPPRILQRGESLEQAQLAKPAQQAGPAQQAKSNFTPFAGLYDNLGQPRPGQVIQPSPSALLIPMSSQAQTTHHTASNYNYKPNVSPEQKRALLSLFGTPAKAAADAQRPGSAATGHSMPRMGSISGPVGDGQRNAPPSRNSNATPISQADQSFLLGYLQSVTKNAAR
ncbi:Dcp2, box A domain-containing protein [Trichoderma austrokoningii]